MTISPQNTNIRPIKADLQTNTKNKSFINMHIVLKNKGIGSTPETSTRNCFFLVIYDSGLKFIDPYSPNLNVIVQARILNECCNNYWYFLREVIRIPVQGGAASYELHRGNLALNFCMELNLNVFCEMPRQHGKTIAVICRLLWVFLFSKARNFEMSFINKKFEDSKLNLARLKEIRRALPIYLQANGEVINQDGKKERGNNSVTSLLNGYNRNLIKTIGSATSKIKASSLGRGCTQPIQWYDEFAFIPFNKDVYMSATPAFETASKNAKEHNAPYGIIITTTPGMLTDESGVYANKIRTKATRFNEMWYNLSIPEIHDMIAANKDSQFVYISFTYKQLGRDEKWFAKVCKDLENDWETIRREVLLEWAESSDNCPFTKEELRIVESKTYDPITTVYIRRNYPVNIYSDFKGRPIEGAKYRMENQFIMGVDVSGGLHRDSSTFTLINARTTKVEADFNCNYIDTHEFARVIYDFVSQYYPNTVIVIERNGGFGLSVISDLKRTELKDKLYYEYKEKVQEERVVNGFETHKIKANVKCYGFDNTPSSREQLHEILRMRMRNHKDKFISKFLLNEFKTLIVTKSGRIDHSPNGHDDQVFSYMLAMYVWTEGKHLKERYGIEKHTIKTDQDEYDEICTLEEEVTDISNHFQAVPVSVKSQIKWLNQHKSQSMKEFRAKENQKDDKAFLDLLANPRGRKAIEKANPNLNFDRLAIGLNARQNNIPDECFTKFTGFYDGLSDEELEIVTEPEQYEEYEYL